MRLVGSTRLMLHSRPTSAVSWRQSAADRFVVQTPTQKQSGGAFHWLSIQIKWIRICLSFVVFFSWARRENICPNKSWGALPGAACSSPFKTLLLSSSRKSERIQVEEIVRKETSRSVGWKKNNFLFKFSGPNLLETRVAAEKITSFRVPFVVGVYLTFKWKGSGCSWIFNHRRVVRQFNLRRIRRFALE